MSERVGPLVVAGLIDEFAQTRELKIPRSLPYQVRLLHFYMDCECFNRVRCMYTKEH